MTKKAMIELHKEGIIPHIQVHDELDISVESPEHAQKIKDIMENAVDLEVPNKVDYESCLLYTSPSPRDRQKSRMPSSA